MVLYCTFLYNNVSHIREKRCIFVDKYAQGFQIWWKFHFGGITLWKIFLKKMQNYGFWSYPINQTLILPLVLLFRSFSHFFLHSYRLVIIQNNFCQWTTSRKYIWIFFNLKTILSGFLIFEPFPMSYTITHYP